MRKIEAIALLYGPLYRYHLLIRSELLRSRRLHRTPHACTRCTRNSSRASPPGAIVAAFGRLPCQSRSKMPIKVENASQGRKCQSRSKMPVKVENANQGRKCRCVRMPSCRRTLNAKQGECQSRSKSHSMRPRRRCKAGVATPALHLHLGVHDTRGPAHPATARPERKTPRGRLPPKKPWPKRPGRRSAGAGRCAKGCEWGAICGAKNE